MISIIIVNYNVGQRLLNCIKSIYDSNPKVEFEIIVVENGKENLNGKLKKLSSQIKYVISSSNLGYAGGNNLGTQYAKGDYIFVLNPDTIVEKEAIDNLLQFIKSNNKIGAVSPLLVDKNLNPFETQSKKELTPMNSIFSFSALRRLLPSKSIYKDIFFKTWNKKSPIEVEALPGAALLIPKKIFEKLNGFDESFFLYFEENDLSKRIRNLGLKLFVIPNAKVIHEVGQSTKVLNNRQEVFEKSRFYFFKKHYGFIKALATELIIRFDFPLFFILLGAFFLRIYNIFNGMHFIGDFAWFYISARDMIITGNIPLVGITSSHTWLHQGPLWTYILSIFLPIFKFSPFTGAYITITLGILSTYLIYKVSNKLLSKKIAIITSLLYATSPLVIFSDRIPYHTSPIPILVIFYYYFLAEWINGKKKFLPFTILMIVLLYNFELATFSLFFPFLFFIGYGVYKKRDWFVKTFTRKYLLLSLLAFVIPMLPILAYDLFHGYKQTLVFVGWTIYKPLSTLISLNFSLSTGGVLNYLSSSLSRTLFSLNPLVAIAIFIFSLIFLLKEVISTKKNKLENSKFILLFLTLTEFLAIVINKTPSDAYLPMTFPLLIISVAIFFDYLASLKNMKLVLYLILAVIVFSNVCTSINNDRENQFKNLKKTSNKILDLADRKSYNLIGEGPGSQFESFTMNYQYLLWLYGNPPLKKDTNLKIILKSDGSIIEVLKK